MKRKNEATVPHFSAFREDGTMNIGRQWEDRLKIWSAQFEKHYYQKHAPMCMSFFTTMEHLAFHDAVNGSFAPAPSGTKWGKKWEYAWFRTTLTIPEALAGKRVVFTLNVAEEMLVWVNGREAGAIDKQHKFITLSRCAKAGDTYVIHAEAYAGHGVRNETAGIVAWGEEPVPEPPLTQVTVGESSYGIWNEELFQVAMDYKTLYSLVKKLPDKSLRAMKIIEGLKQFTYAADFELPEPELTASVVAADRWLKPLLACKNGSTAPEYTIFGQSHLDMAWLWPVEETMRKTARTYSNQLALMEEYEDYQFLLCEPPILEFLKELYPDVYHRVLEKVHSGAFCPEGAMWIESDTNIPSGESLIRQFVYGKRWFRNELGVESKLAWMPDTFGFSAALPQILRKCQVPYFATQKLLRQDPEAEPFPYNLFWWEGMDGSKVLSHIYKKNNAVFDSGDLITRWEDDRIQQENISGLLYPFGYGDGGGGPTREMLEVARRCTDLEGAPRCKMENPVRYFDRAMAENVENTFWGELYLAWHRGTYTAQARTKKGIRKAEAALKQVEFQLAERMLAGQDIPDRWKKQLDHMWKTLLFNQFHDVAAGASIRRVHARAEEELTGILESCRSMLREMLGDGSAVAFNHLSWPVHYKGVDIPAQGSALIPDEGHCSGAQVRSHATGYVLENQQLQCFFDENAQLVRVRRAGSSREYMAAPGNRFEMFKDVNGYYDAWELSCMYRKVPVCLDGDVHIRTFTDTDGAGLLVERKLHDSTLCQRILLGHQSDRLDFITRIDWQERHKILKVVFPVNVFVREAIHEIQFGFIKRTNHHSYQTDKDRFEVCNQRYTALADGAMGAAVLNDCKYGVSVDENQIQLTLLKSPLKPDMHADRGIQEFTYSFLPFEGPFRRSDVVRQAIELNEPPVLGSSLFRPEQIFLAAEKNIVVDTVKPADTVPKGILVRVYESMGMDTLSAYTVTEKAAAITETDMLEENPVPVGDILHFKPFEIKTLILHL